MRRVLFGLIVAAAALAMPGHAAAAIPRVPWCGNDQLQSDRIPDGVGGRQVHVVYAIPSDGGERFGELASAITTDLAFVDSWWRREDPTRVPRWDVFAFPGCAPGLGRLDLTFARLPNGFAHYRAISTRFSRLIQDLTSSPFGLADDDKKYLVYYDAPVEAANVCGQGARAPDRMSYAILYVQVDRCGVVGEGYYAASTAAHELLHALGAVPDGGPPHGCPGDPAHVCDHGRDVMLGGGTPNLPLTDYLLDAGRDDYYGHAGPWFDIQDSRWLTRIDRAQVPLTVSAGSGGTVASTLPGIVCPPGCSVTWDAGEQVTLNATPADELRLVGWTGDCSGRDSCVVTMDAPRTVGATFGPAFFTLTISVSGRGRVIGALIADCSARCTEVIDADTRVVLRPVAARGWRFASWAGACRGKRVTCAVTMDAARSVRATFRRR